MALFRASLDKNIIPWTLIGTAIDTANISNNGGVLRLTQRENQFSIHLKGMHFHLHSHGGDRG